MCTLTFIPKGETEFIITSNRDEAVVRKTIPPRVYIQNGIKLLFPKDELAGGTWIGASSKKRLICLLNGGFKPHVRKNEYRKSRGVVVTDLLKAESTVAAIEVYDLSDIEPFTIVTIDWSETLKLYQLVWDGKKKHFSELESNSPHIWSAAMLYTDEMKNLRKEWFASFLKEKNLHPQALLNFHKNAGIGNQNTDLQIDRGFLKTVSITQIHKKDEHLDLHYENLLNGEIEKSTESFSG